jgi:hypothetical protein
MKPRNALVKNRKKAARLRRARQKRWLSTDHGKYMRARNNALQRGVEWLFTEAEWLEVWKKSGHFAERGRGPGQYQMARKGDCGPYAEWNVAIVRMEANACACAISAGLCVAVQNPALRDEVASIL